MKTVILRGLAALAFAGALALSGVPAAADTADLAGELAALKAEVAEIKAQLQEVLARDTEEAPPAAATADPAIAALEAQAQTLKAFPIVLVRPEPALLENGERPEKIPQDVVGAFVGSEPWRNSELADRGVRYSNNPSYELQGWLKVDVAGRYQIGVDVGYPGETSRESCIVRTAIEGVEIKDEMFELASYEQTLFSSVAGAELQPGLYATSIWIACAPIGAYTPEDILFTPVIKRPDEYNLRPLRGDDFLHKAS